MAVFGKQASAAAISRILQAKVLLIGGLIIMVLSLAFGTYFVMTRSTATHSIPVTRSTTTTVTQTQPTVTSSNYQAEVTAVGKQYMNALLQQKYDVMWSMLHPQVQAQWSDEQAFASYLKAHFQGYTLQSFSSGTVSQLSFWVNPETMVQYNTVQLMPISLQLKSQLPPQQQARLAPQFQHPSSIFQNLPFIVQLDPSSATGANQHWLILSGGPADPEAPILPPTTLISRTVKVPILMYHYISVVPANDPNPVLRQGLSVSPQLFNQQLDYLKQQGFHSITVNQLMNALYYGAPLPSKPIIFTFDDGYLDAYTNAYPALKAHGFSGMFYIITGKVGWQGQMSWNQMREMLANGMQMGSHTVHHVDMGTTYLASVMQATQEVQVSQADMQSHLGIVVQHFCYPNGGPFKGHNLLLQQEVVALLAANGYVDATTDPGPTGVMQSDIAPFVLLRLRMSGRSSFQYFVSTMQAYV